MGKRAYYEKNDLQYCECKLPKLEKDYVDVQEGGEIVSRFIGYVCMSCHLPPNPNE